MLEKAIKTKLNTNLNRTTKTKPVSSRIFSVNTEYRKN